MRGARLCPHCRTELEWLKTKENTSLTPDEHKRYLAHEAELEAAREAERQTLEAERQRKQAEKRRDKKVGAAKEKNTELLSSIE